MNLIFSIDLALILAVVFAIVVVYLRCCQGSTIRSQTGFQRYEPLVQDENDSPIVERMNGRRISKNNHPMTFDSDDEDNETLFSSKMKKTMIP
jgi:hypothetical protein